MYALMGGILGGVVLLGYIVVSAILLRYPTLIHKKKKMYFICRHISHRGGAGENLENTLTALRHAVDLGTDMLEIDCQLTKDHQVVVSHDNLLSRTTGNKINVSDTEYKDLPLLKPQINIDFLPGQTTDEGCEDRQIPLLEDVFKAFPTIPINIDCKENSDVLMSKIRTLIAAYKRQHMTVWGNRSEDVNKKLYKLDPDIHLLFSMKRVIWTTLWFYLGILPFVSIKESFYEIIMPSIALPFIKPEDGYYRLKRAVIHIADFLLMSKLMFAHYKRRGIQVYLWVLNDDAAFQRAFDLGATGVMTDYPTKLKAFMEENNLFDPTENQRLMAELLHTPESSPSMSPKSAEEGGRDKTL